MHKFVKFVGYQNFFLHFKMQEEMCIYTFVHDGRTDGQDEQKYLKKQKEGDINRRSLRLCYNQVPLNRMLNNSALC